MPESTPYMPPAAPVPASHEVEPRKSPCGHGRAPKDRRGSRNERLRGRIVESLHGGRKASS